MGPVFKYYPGLLSWFNCRGEQLHGDNMASSWIDGSLTEPPAGPPVSATEPRHSEPQLAPAVATVSWWGNRAGLCLPPFTAGSVPLHPGLDSLQLLLCFCYTHPTSPLVKIIIYLSWNTITWCCFIAKSCLTLLLPHRLIRQAPLSMGSSRQEYCSGWPFPPPGDLSDPGIEPTSPALQEALTTEQPGDWTIIWHSPYKLMKFPLASKKFLESSSQHRRLAKWANQTLVHKLLLKAALWPSTHLFLLSSKPYLPLLSIPQRVLTLKQAWAQVTLQQCLFSPCTSVTARSWHIRTGHAHSFLELGLGFRFSVFSGFKPITAGTMPRVLWHLKT